MLAAGESILLYLLLFFFLTRVPSFRLVNGAAENVLSRREVCTMPLSLSLLLYIYIYMYIFFTCVPDRRLVIDSVDNVLFARNLCCVFFVFILFPVYQIEGQSAMILPYSLHKEVLRCAVCLVFFFNGVPDRRSVSDDLAVQPQQGSAQVCCVSLGVTHGPDRRLMMLSNALLRALPCVSFISF